MIIDAILDRKAGFPYNEKQLRYMYDEAVTFGFEELARAIDCGDNSDIVRELCKYVDSGEYNPDIKGYIKSQDWLNV